MELIPNSLKDMLFPFLFIDYMALEDALLATLQEFRMIKYKTI